MRVTVGGRAEVGGIMLAAGTALTTAELATAALCGVEGMAKAGVLSIAALSKAFSLSSTVNKCVFSARSLCIVSCCAASSLSVGELG